MTSGWLNLEEALEYLNINKPELEKLLKTKKITAYKIGGAYLRLKKEQLIVLKHEMYSQKPKSYRPQLQNFWTFYRFYILASIVLVGAFVYFLTI